MTSVLIFVAALAAIVAGGWIVSKVNGSHAWFIETWQYNDGETVLWRDDRADVAIVTKYGQAVITRPLRYHRWPVVVTNERIIIGNKTFTGRQMVKYVLYPGRSPDQESKRTDGGLLSRGYASVVIQPGVVHTHLDDRLQPPYVALTPLAAEPSSINLSEIRIYTDLAASFRVPPVPLPEQVEDPHRA